MIQTINIPKDKKLIFVGDINANEYQFNKLITKTKVGTESILVSVGNVYNKDYSDNTISESIIRQIKSLYNNGWAFMVRGNHEQRNINKKVLTPELKWCLNLPLIISFVFYNQTRVTVMHGGITPYHNWNNINNEIMYIRNLDKDGNPIIIQTKIINGNKVFTPTEVGVPWGNFYDGRFGYVIHGNAIDSDGAIKYNKRSCNIDTCCYKTGILSGLIIINGMMNDLFLIDDS